MPATPLAFRAKCGCFVTVFVSFMFRRAKKKAELQCRTLTAKNRLHGVMVGLVLTVFYFSNLIMQCGDVESNPGPPKLAAVRQTRLTSISSLSRRSVDDGAADRGHSVQTEPTLTQVVEMLSDLSSTCATTSEDVRDIKEKLSVLENEVKDIREEMKQLKRTNDVLTENNKKLQEHVDRLELKTDDLECRSKRNNIIIHGIPRSPNETPEQCENLLTDMITDTLELSDNICFDRVHRLSSKKDSPMIARCAFYKQKVQILKAKGKLKGSTVFIGEDFSARVRAIRKKLAPHLKAAKDQGKRATMVYDHLIIEGKKFFLSGDETDISDVF